MQYPSDTKTVRKEVDPLGTVGTLCEFGLKMAIQECQANMENLDNGLKIRRVPRRPTMPDKYVKE